MMFFHQYISIKKEKTKHTFTTAFGYDLIMAKKYCHKIKGGHYK